MRHPLIINYFRRDADASQTKETGASMAFEFGETQASAAFFERNPKFLATFMRLIEVSNKYLGNRPPARNQFEELCLGLAHACRQDFLEIVFMAVNGYSVAASKLTRGLYERSLTLAYIVEDKAKAERFVRFAAVQEHRALIAALEVVSEQEFDASMGSPNSAAEVRKRYEAIKSEFQVTLAQSVEQSALNPHGTLISHRWSRRSVDSTGISTYRIIRFRISRFTPRWRQSH